MAQFLQNIVYKGKNNPVTIDYEFKGAFATDGLANFTDIQVLIGEETYTLLLDPTNIVVNSNTQFELIIGVDTTLAPGAYPLTVFGVGVAYPEGFVLNEPDDELGRVHIKQL